VYGTVAMVMGKEIIKEETIEEDADAEEEDEVDDV
jgi:hypothetical protein